MFYFIPSWYQGNQWRENEQKWYIRRMKSEFDDTVKQIQLFHRNTDYKYMILVLSSTPNFRHFLHRQGIYHAPYWSCFDAIQRIKKKKIRMFSFYDLNWPKNVEFIYSPFTVVAYLNDEKYAEIDFAEDGNPIQIDMFDNGEISRRNIYDDRGFVSSTVVFENGQPIHSDYLDDRGRWCIRLNINDGSVCVNPTTAEYLISYGDNEKYIKYQKNRYQSISELIEEVFKSYLSYTSSKDIFCVAMHNLHLGLVAKTLKNKKIIVSFFKERFIWDKLDLTKKLLDASGYIITDSAHNTERIIEKMGTEYENIIDITPYDFREDLGISNKLKVQNIFVPIDKLRDGIFEKLVVLLAQYNENNKNVRIYFLTRDIKKDKKSGVFDRLKTILIKKGYRESYINKNFFVEQCVDELSVSKCMREQRIIIDLRDFQDVFLQVSGISMGIPQIVLKETQFVEHKKNGYVLKSLDELPEVLDYYLLTLANWNKAMINALQIGRYYTTDKLLDSWRKVIEEVG